MTDNALTSCVRSLIEVYGDAIRNGETKLDLIFAIHNSSGLIYRCCTDTIIGWSDVKNGSEHEISSLTSAVVSFLEQNGVRGGAKHRVVLDEFLRYIVFPLG
jgi:hypothetical protein